MPGTPEARTRRGGDRSRSRAPVVTAARQDRRAVYPPACLPVTSSWPGTGCPQHGALECADRSRPACVTAATSWNVTRRPINHQVRRPAKGLARTRSWPRVIAAAIAAVADNAEPVRRHSCRGRIRQGPSMYEMEGPCPASPHRLASCLALLAQRAARRGQAPARGTGLPAPPAFPGSPPGDARFRTVKHFYCLCRRRARAGGRPFSGFSLSTKESTENGQLSAFDGGYPRACSQPIHRFPSVSRRTPQPPVPNARCYVTS
jgi:hypothetical protein